MLAVVLSGGGSKGAYQIGVWEALRKLNIRYDIVTGASVGALNGALMVQNDFKLGKQLWQNLDFNMIFQNSIQVNPKSAEGLKELFLTYGKAALKGGMNIQPLEKTITKCIDKTKFYQSSIDYGLTTINLSDLKPLSLKKAEIPKEYLVDYLIASATCFPVFPMKKIQEDYYIDGGYFDNIPIDLAISLGATEIIVVDISGNLLKKEQQIYSIPITYIRPRNKTGNFLVFHKELAKINMRYGYLDTMKVFHKLSGNKVTFEKKEYEKVKNHILEGLAFSMKEEKHDYVVKQYQKRKKNPDSLLDQIVDCLGTYFDLDLTKIYTKKSFLNLVKKKYQTISFPSLAKLRNNLKQRHFQQLDVKLGLLKYGSLLLDILGEKMFFFFSTEIFTSLYLNYLMKH